MTVKLIIMAACLLLSAYFSATETAFSTLNKTRLKAMIEKGNKKAKKTLETAENYDRLISTILIGNNIVNIAMASVATLLFVDLLGADKGATVSTAVVTIVVLIFGEITPKGIAKDMPEKFAIFSTPFIRSLIWILVPLTFIFSQWKKLISRLFKKEENEAMIQEELLLLVEEVTEEGSIDESEGELLKNAIEFGDLSAQDILTHRVDLEAVEINDSKEEIAKVFTETRFSRLPVYEETIDRIVGVLHQKDFYVGTGITDKDIKDIITTPVFIHKSEKVDDLLDLLQADKSHVAIVLDEYGGTAGIVTMEDILEELVGDIWDEHDEVEEEVSQLGEDLFEVDGSMNIGDFCEQFDIDPETASTTLGGWIMETMENLPEEGDVLNFEHLIITVKTVDNRRVEKATVAVGEKVEGDEE
ncbi:MAG: HlyC/CorC family transporter [Clostridia bacterium]|nr:HlyC/CorC family transporter [Clostridia bacterium]